MYMRCSGCDRYSESRNNKSDGDGMVQLRHSQVTMHTDLLACASTLSVAAVVESVCCTPYNKRTIPHALGLDHPREPRTFC